MSQQITTAFVQQYNSNVQHLSQQQGSRLAPHVRNETQQAESEFYDRLGATAAIQKVSRHSDTPLIDSQHSRRRVTMSDYEWADLVDKQDKIRTLISPESEYVKAAVWALGRSKDDVIIAEALGTAYSGQNGATTVAHPNSQKIGATDGTNATALNVLTLRRANEKFGTNDVDESEERFIACSQHQITSLLGETAVTSADYNNVKALVEGKVDTFLGFKFIRIQRLQAQSAALAYSATDGSVGAGGLAAAGHERAFAWAKNGLLLATGMDITTRITERADKSYAVQVYACMSIGATRMEEVKVVEILCDL